MIRWPWISRKSAQRRLLRLSRELVSSSKTSAEAARRLEAAGLRDKAFEALGRSQGLFTAAEDARYAAEAFR